jgi:hypothetical protein
MALLNPPAPTAIEAEATSKKTSRSTIRATA